MARQTLGTRLYTRLLRMYPRDFREEYGDEMTRLYRDRADGEGVVGLWLTVLGDVLRVAPREHLAMSMQDIRHACRHFLRTPVVAATAVLTIALGVGASTAVFSVAYAIMLRPLPYPSPDRLVELFEANPQRGVAALRVSAPNYESWQERATGIDALAAFQGTSLNLTQAGDPERLLGTAVTPSMFDVLALAPLVGRGLRAEDAQPGATRVAVLGESLWRRRFGGDAAIVGQSITLDDERHEVVGVMPQAFRDVGRAQVGSLGAPEIFVPLVIEPGGNRANHVLRVVGRLRPGVTVDGARDEMARIAAQLAQEFPATNAGWGVHIVTLYESMLDENVRPSLLVLLGAVGMVLLVACTNVASMLLARSLARQSELALRTALGAGRSRLIRQLVTEGMCLAVVGGIGGLLLALASTRLLPGVLPTTLPRIDEIRIDAAVFGVGVLLTLVSGLVMGAIPAMRASRVVLAPVIAQQGRALAGSSRLVIQRGIVVVQLALATMLLVGAALMLHSFVQLQHVDLGFTPDRVLSARVSLPRARYPDDTLMSASQRQLLESLEAIPQVEAASFGTSAPFTPGVRAGGRLHDGRHAAPSPESGVGAVQHFVSARYFETLRIGLLAGRDFGVQDVSGSVPVAVISASGARQLWPGENPVGRTVGWNGGPQYQVIGVVSDVRGASGQARGGRLDQEPPAALYLSAAQAPPGSVTLLVRTAGEPSAAVLAMRRAVQQIDATQPLHQVRPLREWLDESIAQPRFITVLSGVFACVALLLAAIGAYGVLSYAVTQRTREIGVRIAVGAERRTIIALVLRGGLSWALAGIALGLCGAFVLSGALRAVLFNVSARDPATYGVVSVVLAIVATVACIVPAARAARIDPVVALRSE